MSEAFQSKRFYFSSIEDAALALITILEDARSTKMFYEFGSLSAEQVFASGLVVSGEISEIAPKIEALPGAMGYVE